MGFEEATPIQKETIPHALLGKDVIGQAQTGTGKTAAFGIPMIEQFESREKRILGLIVAPTRELAIQVAEEVNRISRSKRIRALDIFGGTQMERNILDLRLMHQLFFVSTLSLLYLLSLYSLNYVTNSI